MVELVNAFRKSGPVPTSHADAFKSVTILLTRLYGRTEAADFKPVSLKALRQQMIAAGWHRRTVNDRFYIARRIFRWGVEHELVPGSVSQALDAVAGLRAAQSDAKESVGVKPVNIEHVNACIPFMPTMVADMVRLQLLTGMRAGELVIMRTADVETSDAVWVYRPSQHKSQNRGKTREIPFGPEARKILRLYLKGDLMAYIFSPTASERERRAAAQAARTTPLNAGNRPGLNLVEAPTRSPGDRYDVAAYRRAVTRATNQAFPPPRELAKLRGEGEVQFFLSDVSIARCGFQRSVVSTVSGCHG